MLPEETDSPEAHAALGFHRERWGRSWDGCSWRTSLSTERAPAALKWTQVWSVDTWFPERPGGRVKWVVDPLG